ncbi:aldo/keto reductase [Rubrivirga litoralis]|uniref:Aldo/keto reductase n=1 Tax=Rubrivirga litoralis TaxID=3075598 RepID=A0ABU3BTZ0_9BACT|nr:aldo/keto reductase [Rubrivirga sp. F394]MDT0632760.1 aldo/keto reductase [Rubrivirga sp. F394]
MTHYDVHGVSIPALGFGTWQITGDAAREAVEHALALGYRHIDTAQIYGNEAEVGAALAASSVPRDDVFLTTKVWTDQMGAGRLGPSVDESLEKLGTDHVDLLLLHWPNDSVPLDQMLRDLDTVREAGKARLVGVSNYPAGLLRRALDVVPELATDQVEYHPFLDQSALLDVVRDRGMVLTAYSPLAQGEAVSDETLREIGEAHGATAAQVALAWLLDQDRVVAIPKASSASHREGNLGALDVSLTDDDRARIAALPKDHRLANPDFAPDWDA